jgi:hypothetical protein
MRFAMVVLPSLLTDDLRNVSAVIRIAPRARCPANAERQGSGQNHNREAGVLSRSTSNQKFALIVTRNCIRKFITASGIVANATAPW